MVVDTPQIWVPQMLFGCVGAMKFLPVSRVIAGEAHAALRCLFGVSRARACDSARTTRLATPLDSTQTTRADDALGRRESDDSTRTTRVAQTPRLRRLAPTT